MGSHVPSPFINWLVHRQVTPGRHSGSTTPTKSLLPVPGWALGGQGGQQQHFLQLGTSWTWFCLLWQELITFPLFSSKSRKGEMNRNCHGRFFVGCWETVPIFMDPIWCKTSDSLKYELHVLPRSARPTHGCLRGFNFHEIHHVRLRNWGLN